MAQVQARGGVLTLDSCVKFLDSVSTDTAPLSWADTSLDASFNASVLIALLVDHPLVMRGRGR